MNKKNDTLAMRHMAHAAIVALCAATAWWSGIAAAQTSTAPARAARTARPAQAAPTPPPARHACASLTAGETAHVALGKSVVISLSQPAVRLISSSRAGSQIGRPVDVADAGAARAGSAPAAAPAALDGVADTDITLLSPTELLVIGRRSGSANVIVQDRDGRCIVRDIIVTVDPGTLQAKLAELLPGERGVRVAGAEQAIVLTGTVSNSASLDQVISVATAYGDGKKVVNLLRVDAPSQVMLEVKIAEVSKNIIDRFGLDFSRAFSSGGVTNVISGIIGGGSGLFSRIGAPGTVSGTTGSAISGGVSTAGTTAAATGRSGTLLGIDLQKQDGIIRVLAEPNIMAVSGQSASFLSGGKIFIPVAQSNTTGGTTITLEEKEFGVGVKFTPTVLDGNRINLKLVTEASELSQTGSPFTTVGNVTSVLPSVSTRRVDTTVQLGDGQSFLVAGLVKNNLNETLKRVPGLGEVPVLGALFRSNEFQTDQTELMFVVTPRLVKPLGAPTALPTDNHVPADRNQAVFGGSGEAPAAAPPATNTPAPAPADTPPAASGSIPQR